MNRKSGWMLLREHNEAETRAESALVDAQPDPVCLYTIAITTHVCIHHLHPSSLTDPQFNRQADKQTDRHVVLYKQSTCVDCYTNFAPTLWRTSVELRRKKHLNPPLELYSCIKRSCALWKFLTVDDKNSLLFMLLNLHLWGMLMPCLWIYMCLFVQLGMYASVCLAILNWKLLKLYLRNKAIINNMHSGWIVYITFDDIIRKVRDI